MNKLTIIYSERHSPCKHKIEVSHVCDIRLTAVRQLSHTCDTHVAHV